MENEIPDLPETSKEVDLLAGSEAFKIYGYLKNKYPESTVRDFDIIMNSLCCALVRHGVLNTDPMDNENYSEICKQIILKNIVHRRKT